MLHLILAVALASSTALLAQLEQRVSSDQNDYNPSVDQAERTMVFARSKADFEQARILVSERTKDGWTDPRPIDFSDERYSDSDPWLTADGQTLYFVSNRPTASRPDKTDLDIWRARRLPSGWSVPEHLGDAVNSSGPELGPEVHGDILTFASVRRGGKGGLDIFQSRQTTTGFGPPMLLDGPFNTPESESDFTISSDGRLSAFWRGGQTATIFISERQGDGWSQPVELAPAINVGPFNFTPAFSADSRSLWFASTLEREGQERGMADIYRAQLPAKLR